MNERRFRLRPHPPGRDNPSEGDFLIQRGPKLGERMWLIVDVEMKRTLLHCTCVPGEGVAIAHAATGAERDVYWYLTS